MAVSAVQDHAAVPSDQQDGGREYGAQAAPQDLVYLGQRRWVKSHL
jgi:hypothetical protein